MASILLNPVSPPTMVRCTWMEKNPAKPAWEGKVSDEDWAVYQPVLSRTEREGVLFALGGAFALAAYTGHLRNTKDLDVYVLPEDRDRMIAIVETCGMKDYYPRVAYDRSWIHRSIGEGQQIIDIIWSMPNRRSVVDEQWLTRGPLVELRQHMLRVIPIEELLWAKMYVIQRERCDWPDVWNLLFHSGSRIDWNHLFERIGSDLPLLKAILTIFRWLCPDRAEMVPSWVWEKLRDEESGPESGSRPFLLDTRPWFGFDFQHWPGQ